MVITKSNSHHFVSPVFVSADIDIEFRRAPYYFFRPSILRSDFDDLKKFLNLPDDLVDHSKK